MKKFMYGLAIILALVSCEKDLYEDQIRESNVIEKKSSQKYVSIAEVPELIPTIQQYNRAYDYLSSGDYSNHTGRGAEELDLDLEHILKVVGANGKESYSINIKKAFDEYEDIFFENLHIYEKDGSFTSKILKYNPLDDSEKFDMETFTGSIEMYDKDRNLQGIFQYEGGLQRCEKLTIGCYHIWYFTTTDELWIWFDCGGGGGGGSGGDDAGGTGNSGNSGDGFSNGSNSGSGNTYGSNNGTSSGTNGSAPNPGDPTLLDHTPIAPNDLWPEVTTQLDQANRIANRVGLDTSTRQFLRAPMNAVVTDEIYYFLYPSPLNDFVANDFAKQASIAIKNGGTVNFQNRIIIDPSVSNNSKVNCVLNKMMSLNSGSHFQSVLQNLFGSSTTSNLKIEIRNLPASSGLDAVTWSNSPYILGNNSLHTIILDSTFVSNASTIEIAMTILHEAIHAEIMERCLQLGIVSQVNMNFSTYDALVQFSNGTSFTGQAHILNALIQNYRTFPLPDQWSHNLMTTPGYFNTIVQDLTLLYPLLNDSNNDFLTNINNDPSNTFGNFTLSQAFQYLSWTGLESTLEYSNQVTNIPGEINKKNYISNAIRVKSTKICIP